MSPAPQVRMRTGPVLGFVLANAVAGCSACEELPSSQTTNDGRDLRGVFERSDAGVDGGVVAELSSAEASADAGPPPEVVQPASAAGSCVAKTGEAAGAVSRIARRPACRGAIVSEWQDADGAPRYACTYRPTRKGNERFPLVVYFHPHDATPDALRKRTNLRRESRTYGLSDAESTLGYIVVSPQGRLLDGGKRGVVFDTAFPTVENLDVQTTDHFVDALIQEGVVDESRIYAVGHGTGGTMAATYAAVRADRVAAFIAFGSTGPSLDWTCPTPPPAGLIVYRDCDAMAPCDAVERWVEQRRDASAVTTALRLGSANREAPHCAVNKCGNKVGTANHGRWPKGRETEMLEFLKGRRLGGR